MSRMQADVGKQVRTVAICAAAFLLAGGGISLWAGAKWLELFALQTWVECPAEILEVKWIYRERQSSTTRGLHGVHCRYRYSFDGAQYEGTRLALIDSLDSNPDFWSEVHDELAALQRAGQPVLVLVDPEEPSQALVYPHVNPALIIASLLAGFLLLGGLFAALSYSRLRERLAGPLGASEPWQAREQWRAGVVVPSRWRNILLAGLVTFLLTFFLVAGIAASLLPRRTGMDPALIWAFSIPGLGGAAAVLGIYLARVMRYGTPRLLIPEVPLRTGACAGFTLEVDRGLKGVKALRLSLTCRRIEGENMIGKVVHRERLEVEVPPPQVEGWWAIPVRWELPHDLPETDLEGAVVRNWELEVHSKGALLNRIGRFAVPIFAPDFPEELLEHILHDDFEAARAWLAAHPEAQPRPQAYAERSRQIRDTTSLKARMGGFRIIDFACQLFPADADLRDTLIAARMDLPREVRQKLRRAGRI